MKVFLTGATGYIGSAVAEKLLAAGHQVTGLARSPEAARKLEERGVDPVPGSLHDSESIARAARSSDCVIHTAPTNKADMPEADALAVSAILEALDETGHPFIYTSGVWVLGDTKDSVADEESQLEPTPLVAWRPAIEQRVLRGAARGVRSIVLRPAMVYGRSGGIIGGMVESGRQTGVVRYVGTGENRWSLVHVDDLADLYLRALEKAPAATLLMAASGSPMPVSEVAERAARAAGPSCRTENWPVEQAREKLGPYADALILDQQVSGARAAQLLGWSPQAPSLSEELASQASAGHA